MLRLIRLQIQNFGQFLSNMIMPNISIFITWGIMNALFVPLGWQPNKILAQLIPPIIFYLLPILIGYTGGRLIAGERGGLVGSISTIGMITSTDIPMFLGGMICGPLGAWIIKVFDQIVKNRIKSGFEMLVNNFSIAIIGMFLTIISFFLIGPLIEWTSNSLGSILKIIINFNLLPLIAFIIEPAKVFFLNNAINHGIFSPLGIQEISENKSSLFFLIESNPGPGLGVLIACFFFGKEKLYKSSGGAAIIQFLGGIHEIYFPYVLMKPILMISLILGSMTSIFMLVFFKGGLISAVSPGSILSILAMTKKGLYFANCISVFSSFLISFLSAALFFKINLGRKKEHNKISTESFKKNLYPMKKKGDQKYDFIKKIKNIQKIKNIIIACDAGMGSSAMGASILRKKIENKNLTHISISNIALNLLPKNADLVITHEKLTCRAKKYAPNSQHISLKNFLDNDFYTTLVTQLDEKKDFYKKNNIQDKKDNFFEKNINSNKEIQSKNFFQISKKNIFLNQHAKNKQEAIKIVGKYLVEQGYVKTDYIDAMLDREKIASTWLGQSVALPHGTIEAKDSILKTGVIFCQFPEGVHFGENIDDIAYLVIGIAAKNNEHIIVVSNITNALDDQDIITRLSKTKSVNEVLSYLNSNVKKN
ncbi:PTS mannitol transporter subunit IICBA [uncultured Buchnera sp.]|jgi:mannitol PTS system EIICBA or EIICB component|uniref:PTS mannitol transporter subunit IICBA n=1 Tax=uncultured Buchnera sp. TaxID=574037 RepID=UPI0025F2690F|nr:PTS mannitol transporter subunit IICBA [uncultured Buchnera sp.]